MSPRTSSRQPTTRVVVVGAGYAGVRAARAARRHGASVLVVDTDGQHHFGPRLAGVAAGSAHPADGAAAVGSLTGIPVEVGHVARIDRDRRQVQLHSGTVHGYDALVVTVGAVPSRPPIPGLAEHALTLKTSQDAARILRRVTASRRAIVIGGGSTGVQLTGELAAEVDGLEIELVERADRLLPELPRLPAKRAAAILRRRGVRLHLASTVASVDDAGVDLLDGTRIQGTAIWAGGFRASGNELLPGTPSRDGRLLLRDTLALQDDPAIFVAGDAAAHNDLFGRPVAMSAQIAVQAGRCAGRNAALVASGREAIPALLLDLGRVVTLGGGRGVAQLGPVTLGLLGSDRLVPLLHEAIDLRHLFDTGGLRAILRHGRGQAADNKRPGRNAAGLRLVASDGATKA